MESQAAEVRKGEALCKCRSAGGGKNGGCSSGSALALPVGDKLVGGRNGRFFQGGVPCPGTAAASGRAREAEGQTANDLRDGVGQICDRS